MVITLHRATGPSLLGCRKAYVIALHVSMTRKFSGIMEQSPQNIGSQTSLIQLRIL
jgi:hypothetical protein